MNQKKMPNKIFEQYQQDIKFIEGLANMPRQNYLLGSHDRSVFVLRIKKFLDLVGNPEKKLKFIHVAGTSGKGTTVKVLQSMMSQNGLKIGAYISPFTTTTLEKVSINDKLMRPQDLHIILENDIKPAWDKYLIKYTDDPISYFETWLVIALLYFQRQKCDWVILEAGLGGQHDATNVIKNTKVAAITNIGLDHTDILGNTKEKIAADKAGIIKTNGLFLTTETNKKLLQIFKTKCQKSKSKYLDLKNLSQEYKLSAYFDTPRQTANLNLALNILVALKIKPTNIQKVIDNFQLICRQEVIQKNPIIILDGSHNKDKLDNLINFIQKQKYRKLHLVIGFSFDKNHQTPLKKLLHLSHHVYLTRFLTDHRKTADLRSLYKESKKIARELPINIFVDPYQALAAAQKKANKKDLILVTGSFFLAGELRKKWISEEYIVKNLRFDKK